MTLEDMKSLEENDTVLSLRAGRNLISTVDLIDEDGIIISHDITRDDYENVDEYGTIQNNILKNKYREDRFLWEEAHLLEHYEIKPHMFGDPL